MTILWVILGLLGFFIIATFVVSLFLVRFMTEPKRQDYDFAVKKELKRGFLQGFDELPKESFVLNSFDGYELHCIFVPADDPSSKKFVIITHGHTATLYGSVKYLNIFRSLGYNTLIYDNRGHGANSRVPVSMGVREHRDLNFLIDYLKDRFGQDIYLGLHGESMGSAISNMILGIRQDIAFVVSDCGYYDLDGFCKMCVHDFFHLPTIFIIPAGFLCRKLYGFSLSEVSPIKALAENTVPICFIHGAADSFIRPSNAQMLYDTTKGYKELHFFEGADHALSCQTDRVRYHGVIEQFLEKINKP